MVRGTLMATFPPPVCVTAPSEVMSPLIVSKPPLLKTTAPPAVVVMVLFTAMASPVVRLTPVGAVIA